MPLHDAVKLSIITWNLSPSHLDLVIKRYPLTLIMSCNSTLSHLNHVIELVVLSPRSCHGTRYTINTICHGTLHEERTHLNHVMELVTLRIEGCGADLATLIEEVHAEKFALATRVAPSLDRRLRRHTCTDRPPADNAVL